VGKALKCNKNPKANMEKAHNYTKQKIIRKEKIKENPILKKTKICRNRNSLCRQE
jgi:hypothetical protein